MLRALGASRPWWCSPARLTQCGRTVRALRSSAVCPSTAVKMPSLSPTMSEGTIVKWNKAEGESVVAGDVLCEIQTDKAVVALEADEDGTLALIVAQADSGSLPVGNLIAMMADEGEDWREVAKSAPTSASTSSEDTGASTSSSSSSGSTAQPTGGSTPGTEVKMPSLSPTMTEGTIVKWCIQEGEKINPGDVLCEIQTDKAVVAMECDDEAILAKILIQEGESGVEVGKLIALTVEEGEDWQDVQIPAQETSASAGTESEPSQPQSASTPSSSTSGTLGSSHDFEHVTNVGPATHFLMAQYGIKSSQVKASGPKGIVKGDVLQYIKDHNLKPIQVKTEEGGGKVAKGKDTATAATPSKAKKTSSGYTDIPLTSMRTVIAKRLTESKQTSPHGHATVNTTLDRVLQLRKDLAARGIKVSVNDFIIKAAGTALQYVPEMNLNVSREDFQIMSNVDVSVAVATDAGLITPIVKDVPNKSLDQISSDVKDLAARAREGKLQLQEFQGGTFTISNLGMFGITEFTAIINPPQVGILAVGSGIVQIDPITGKPCTQMRSTLSFDRRFIDEALAADFMSTFQTVLERPEFMNLGLIPVARKDRQAQVLL